MSGAAHAPLGGRRAAALATVVAGATLGAPDVALACPEVLHEPWPTRVLAWSSSLGALPREPVERAFRTWTEVPCSDLTLVEDAVAPSVVVEAIGGGWIHGPDVLALTTQAAFSRVPEAAIIELNGEDFRLEVVELGCDPGERTVDIESVVVHEVGHAVGLAHAPSTAEFSGATMFPSAELCETHKRDLAASDIDALCALYPVGATGCRERPPVPVETAPGSAPSTAASDASSGCRHRDPSASSPSPGCWVLVVLALVWNCRSRKTGSEPRSPRGGAAAARVPRCRPPPRGEHL